MTDTLTSVTMPALGGWPNVEIAQTGQWKISTGEVTLTLDDFTNAIAAMECPAIRKPVLKLGHTEAMPSGVTKKRTDGEPAIGFIDNMATADNGHTIVGDYTGMPGWLAAITPSAYPDRSMEATWDFVCQVGHLHPFVITAVSLLGVTPPGIGTLDTLADVANLYGVIASAPVSAGFSVSIKAGDATMPNPQPTQVAAGVTTEDVRRSYYDSGVAYTTWIKEMSLDPLQLITVDEATGEYARVPITLTADGATFGDAVPVEVEYVDAKTTAASRMVYASKDESRQGFVSRVEKELPPAKAIDRVHKAATVAEKGQGTMTDMVKLREALGLAADASDDQVSAAWSAAFPSTPSVTEPATPVAAATPTPTGPLPEGTMLLDSSVVRRLQEGAAQGVAAMAAIQKNTRDTVIAAAIQDGKFPPSRKEHYELMWDGDPVGTESHIKRLAAGVIPLEASGYAGTETYEDDQRYYGLYPEARPMDRQAG